MKANLKKLGIVLLLIGLVVAIILYEIVIPLVGYFNVFGFSWGTVLIAIGGYVFIGALVYAVAKFVFITIDKYNLLRDEQV